MIKAFLLLSTLLFSSEFQVSVSCEKLHEYITVCETNVTLEPIEVIEEMPIYEMTHNIKWGFGDNNGSAFVGNVEVRYENPDINTTKTYTDTNGQFTVPIEPDEAFWVYAYNQEDNLWSTHENKFILRIGTTTGNLLWKEWKPSTSRWIKLDFNGNINLNPIMTEEAITIIPEGNVTSIIYDMGGFE